MRVLVALAVCVPLLMACESFVNKMDQSRADKCGVVDWAKIGERDGFDGYVNMVERYTNVCGELFQPGPYKEGFSKGAARKPRPPV